MGEEQFQKVTKRQTCEWPKSQIDHLLVQSSSKSLTYCAKVQE